MRPVIGKFNQQREIVADTIFINANHWKSSQVPARKTPFDSSFMFILQRNQKYCKSHLHKLYTLNVRNSEKKKNRNPKISPSTYFSAHLSSHRTNSRAHNGEENKQTERSQETQLELIKIVFNLTS